MTAAHCAAVLMKTKSSAQPSLALDLVEPGRDEHMVAARKTTEKLPEGVTSKMMYRDVVRIAWPSFIELTLTQLASMVDLMMVGKLGAAAIAGVGLTTQPKFLMMTMFQAMNVGATALVARHKGASQQNKANLILRQALLLTLVLSLIVGVCAAYILARRRFRFGLKRPMTYWVLLVRVLPPVAFTIPLYTMFSKIGLLNTKIPVTLACVLINVPLIIWFLISFFQDLPEEIEESARVDGATEMQMFLKIVLPLVAPGIAAVAMLSFMYAWNEYTYTVIFTRSPDNYTVPLALSLLNSEDNLTSFGLVAAGGVVSVIPITLFVIFAQNYLISGLSSGAVKE